MKRALVLILALLCVISFTGCKSRAKTLLDGDCIRITQEGAKIAIYDVEGGVTYTFYIRHKKPSNRVLEPYTAVNSDTLLIEQRHKEIILIVKKRKNKYTLRIGKIFPKTSLIKGD